MKKEDKMKKNVLFVINNMRIGGTRSSLINLLSAFPYDKVNVDLFLLSPVGPYMDSIDTHISILKTPFLCRCIFSNLNELTLIEKSVKIFLKILRKIVSYQKLFPYLYKSFAKKVTLKKYEAVIGFQEGESADCSAYFNSKKHYIWLHNNYEYFSGNGKGLNEAYAIADKIIFVAKASLLNFEKYFPNYSNKLFVIKNVIAKDQIIAKAQSVLNEKELRKKDGYHLISVGRLSKQKGFDRAIDAAEALKKIGLLFHWIIIGDGPEKENLQKKIDILSLNDCIKIIGSKKNPYPYMKQVDLLVMTSNYESQPMVILESLILGVPVITTNFASASEILDNKPYGKVVENNTAGIIKGLQECFLNNEIDNMRSSIGEFEYNNDNIIHEILKLF